MLVYLIVKEKDKILKLIIKDSIIKAKVTN